MLFYRFLAGVFFLAISTFYAINAKAENRYEKDGWTVLKSNQYELLLSYKPVLQDFKEISAQDESGEALTAYKPKISGAWNINMNPGEFADIAANQNISIPSKEGFILDYVKVNDVKSYDLLMAPVPNINLNTGETSYLLNESYSETPKWAELKYAGISRDRHIAKLKLTAARYNVESSSIEIPGEIIVKILFSGSEGANYSQKADNSFPISINHFETAEWALPAKKAVNANGNKIGDRALTESSNQWYRLTIMSEGVYKLDASALSSKGVNIPKDKINTIKIFGKGGRELSESVTDGVNNRMNEQAIIVNTDQSGDLESIIFYAAPAWGFEYNPGSGFYHYIHHYADRKATGDTKNDKNYYLLAWGGAEGKRAAAESGPTDSPVNKPQKYIERIFYEEELYNPYLEYGAGGDWLGRRIFPTTFTNVLHNLDRSGKITYRLALASSGDKSGQFTISENNTQIEKMNISASQSVNPDWETVEIDASTVASDNRSQLKFEYYNAAGASASGYFDWYEIHYPRSFLPVNNEIGFFTDPDLEGISEYSINNFSGTIYGFDVTDIADPKLIKNTANTGGMFIFKTLTEAYFPKRFFISANLKIPEISAISMANLRTEYANADAIVITHPDLLQSALAFKEYREAYSELSVSVVTTESIFNEFSNSIKDPTALRDFIAFAYNNWTTKPKYVLLWGDGHFDDKNISTSQKNYVPVHTKKRYNTTTYFNDMDAYVTDDYFARINGEDRIVDIAIGRINVTDPDNGDWMVEKIKHYEQNSSIDAWRTNISLIADDSPQGSNGKSDGDDHTENSENIANILPIDIRQNKIYLVDYPREIVAAGVRKPKVTEELVSTINTRGALLLNWMGHGNPRVWAHEEILDRSLTIPQFKNLDKMFFACAGTCDFGRFDMTDTRAGAEELVSSENGAAIGVFSATRGVFGDDNERIIVEFYNNLFSRDPIDNKFLRLGDVNFNVKQTQTSDNDSKFYLLGDPTMRLNIPDHIVSIETINGVNVSELDTAVNIKALSEVAITGSILNPSTMTCATDFNGTSIITLLDCNEEVKVKDSDETIHKILRQGGALNRSAYPVVNGKFEADFIIPKDISYSNDFGTLYAYAYSNNSKYAMGSTKKVIIGGISSNNNKDTIGPVIDIFMDSRKFKPGDFVRNSPLMIIDLKDESGINTTGKGIGHNIEAWLDDEDMPMDLTDMFTTSLDDPKKGSIEEFLFNLEDGRHEIKIRAWDVYGNYSIESTYFNVISDENDIVIENLINYPNPFNSSQSTTFRFRHNVIPPFDAKVQIYSMDGKLIRTIDGRLTSSYESEIFWDGLDKYGKRLPSAAYPYQLIIKTDAGVSGKKSSILRYIK